MADELFGEIGELAAPLKGAVDMFAAPTRATPGQGFDIGSLIRSVGQGAMDVVGQGPGALVAGATGALDPTSGMSARDRLLIGGLTALGVGMGARQAHMAFKQRLQPDMIKPAPAGFSNLVELGDKPRFTGRLSPLGWAKLNNSPGLHPRQAEIMGAVDYDGVLAGVRQWDPEDAAAQTHGRALFQQYADRVGGAENAQVDWARFDLAVERGVFGYDSNKRIRDLWKKLTSSPQSMTPEESEELFGVVSAVSDATQQAGPDLSVGVVGRIERIEVGTNGPELFVRHPVGWDDGRIVDPVVRAERLRELNYRQLAPRGKEILRRLYQMGMSDWTRAEGAARRLPAEMEVGPEWYPKARAETAKAFGLENVDSDELQRAVASVSFLSEAEDWSTNIEKARRVMQAKDVHDGIVDEDYQAWLRDPKTYTGKLAKQHQKTFTHVWEEFKGAGFKVSEPDMKTVMRLMGGFENVHQIFASTQRRKQRHFYLNIYHPELPYPVTVDRHAFDAFLGMDSGIQDRPIDMAMGGDDQVYDVVADTYRSLADELGIPPHELQAVVWETWRMLKQASPRNGWARNDPFMMPEPGEEIGTNVVYEALNGRDLYLDPGSLTARSPLVMPSDVLKVDSNGLMSVALPDGSVVQIAEIGEPMGAKMRHLYPAVLGADRVPRWAPVRPDRVQNVSQVRAAIPVDSGARGELYLNRSLAEGHPLLDPRDSITLDLEPNQALPKLKGAEVVELGRYEADLPEYELRPLGEDDIDPQAFQDPAKSPLLTHQWVAISGMNNATGQDMTNQLFAELVRDGYKPIRQMGRYTLDSGEVSEEASLLVFGVPIDRAMRLGSKYGQESVLVPQGFIYTDGSGQFRPVPGYEFGMPPEGTDLSIAYIGGQEVTWTAAGVDWSPEGLEPFPGVGAMTNKVRRKVAVRPSARSQRDITEFADELETLGYGNLSIYARQLQLEGWERAVEHLYSDGIQTYAVRSVGQALTAPNAGYVFTRSTHGLPKTAPKVPSMAGTIDDLVATLPVPARRSGQKWVLEANGDEVSSAIEAKALLEQHGETGPFEVRTADGTFTFPNEPKYPKRESVLLKSGRLAELGRRDSPMPDWERDFGFEFDPGFRVGNQRQRLDDRTIAGLRQVTEQFYGEYADAFRRWRLPRVTVTPIKGETYGQIIWTPGGGGEIQLSKEFWGDMDTFMARLWNDRSIDEKGIAHLAKGADVSPESILAHEYGHMLHGVLVQSEGWIKNPRIDKEIRDLAGGAGWRKRTKFEISNTASKEPSELVAEAFSEYFTGTPSGLSLRVVDFINDRLGSALKYRKVVGF